MQSHGLERSQLAVLGRAHTIHGRLGMEVVGVDGGGVLGAGAVGQLRDSVDQSYAERQIETPPDHAMV